MGKLDPTAYDRWWRARIEKEEHMCDKQEGGGGVSMRVHHREKVGLNTLGTPFMATAAESHLSGAGALVKKPQAHADAASPPALVVPGSKAASVAGSKAGSKARSVAAASGYLPAGSHAPSYPKTPQFSVAGTESSEIARKLAGLEQALALERAKRQEAEHEMHSLLVMAQTGRLGGAK